MNSKAVNTAVYILDTANAENPVYESCIAGKIVPYIGWFWRDVDFGATSCHLGILPGHDENGSSIHLVGFMENNKWDYPAFKIFGHKWEMLKTLIFRAVSVMAADSFKQVDEYMQSLLEDEEVRALADNWKPTEVE